MITFLGMVLSHRLRNFDPLTLVNKSRAAQSARWVTQLRGTLSQSLMRHFCPDGGEVHEFRAREGGVMLGGRLTRDVDPSLAIRTASRHRHRRHRHDPPR